jgi:hypothetical protein
MGTEKDLLELTHKVRDQEKTLLKMIGSQDRHISDIVARLDRIEGGTQQAEGKGRLMDLRDDVANDLKLLRKIMVRNDEGIDKRLDSIDNREQSTAADLYERLNKIERAQGYHRERIEKLEDEVLEVPETAEAEVPRRPTVYELREIQKHSGTTPVRDVMAHYIQSVLDRWRNKLIEADCDFGSGRSVDIINDILNDDHNYYKGNDND